MKPDLHRNNFDTLRLFFAVLVIFSHSYPLLRGSNATEPLSRITHGALNFGQVSVWSFFVMSGFLIAGSWQRLPRAGRFIKRRILRIYPGFLVATLLCAVVVTPLATPPEMHEHVAVWNYLSHALRLQMFEQGHPFHRNPIPDDINGSLWSIAFEFWCYIGLAILGVAGLLRQRAVIVAGLLLVMAGHLLIEVRHLSPGGGVLGKIFGYPVFWAIVLPFFLCGVLLRLYGERIKLRTRWAAGAALILCISIFIPHAIVFTAPVFGSYLVIWLAYLPALHPLHLGRWGDFSYGTYLYAFPVQQMLTYHLYRELTPLLLFALAAPISLCVAALSWHGVEKRFMPRSMIKRLAEEPAKAAVKSSLADAQAKPQAAPST